jgi:hypothetical protein
MALDAVSVTLIATGVLTFLTLIVKSINDAYTARRNRMWDVEDRRLLAEREAVRTQAAEQRMIEVHAAVVETGAAAVHAATEAKTEANRAYTEANTVNEKIAKTNQAILALQGQLTSALGERTGLIERNDEGRLARAEAVQAGVQEAVDAVADNLPPGTSSVTVAAQSPLTITPTHKEEK